MTNGRRSTRAHRLALVAVALGVTLVPMRAHAAQLGAPRTVLFPSGPAFINSGDLDEDGLEDLAIGVNLSKELAIVFGKRNGKLRRVVRYPLEDLVTSSAVADFNNDGHLDVAASYGFVFDGTPVAVFLGDGTGRLVRGTDSVALNSADFKPADLNGDGNVDIVGTSSFVSTLLGNGDGTFRDPRLFAPGAAYGVLAIGDVNGDGLDDVVRPDSALRTLTVLLGHPTDVLVESQTLPVVDALSVSAKVGDVDRDGIPDLVVANAFPYELHVHRGLGDGTFVETPIRSDTGREITDVVLADVSGDGLPDALLTGFSGDSLVLMVAQGDGRFDAATVVASIPRPHGIVAADFTGDGRPDVAVLDFESSTLTTVMNLGPTVSRVSSSGTGDRFAVRISGRGFEPGVRVFVGDSETAWPQVDRRSGSSIVLRGGQALADLFPPGIPVAIRVVNPDGWEVSVTFGR